MLSSLWNFRHHLVRYYWYPWYAMINQIFELHYLHIVLHKHVALYHAPKLTQTILMLGENTGFLCCPSRPSLCKYSGTGPPSPQQKPLKKPFQESWVPIPPPGNFERRQVLILYGFRSFLWFQNMWAQQRASIKKTNIKNIYIYIEMNTHTHTYI